MEDGRRNKEAGGHMRIGTTRKQGAVDAVKQMQQDGYQHRDVVGKITPV